eukprot:3787908-Rhodomonas_salina.1
MDFSPVVEDFLVNLVNEFLFGSVQDHLICALDAMTSSNVIEEESRDELLQWSRAHRLALMNVLSRGGALITIQGSGFGVAGSARVRVGVSGCEGSEWVSETSALCLAASGVTGTMQVGLSIGIRAGSISQSLSYETASLSVIHVSNQVATGSVSLSVFGTGLGLQSSSGNHRTHHTGCEASQWESETSTRCLAGGGGTGTRR